MSSWAFAPEPVGSVVAVALWRAYCTEVSDRWYRLHEARPTPPVELERAIAAESGAHLTPTHGVLLVARRAGQPVGTAGIHLVDATTAELQRVFLLPPARGLGGAPLLVAPPRTPPAPWAPIDTRTDLVEARALYTRLGYHETAIAARSVIRIPIGSGPTCRPSPARPGHPNRHC